MGKRKVAVVNRTNLKNFGSVLQVYALVYAIKKLGYSSEVVWEKGNMSKNFDLRPMKAIKTFLKLITHPSLFKSTLETAKYVKNVEIDPEKIKCFDDFVVENFEQSLYEPTILKSVAKTDKYYKFVCGSDQVWATTTLYPDPLMYLRFAPREKRVAYAPSLGRDYIPDYNKRTIRKYINEIDNVSVREDEGQRLIKELTGRQVPVVADPTLLMNAEEWSTIKRNIETPEKYVLCYFLTEPLSEVKQAISSYAKRIKSKVVILGEVHGLDLPESEIIKPTAGPGEFLSLVQNAKCVIADSYHGMLFAINFHRQFWSIERANTDYDQSSRQKSILSRLGLEDRYLNEKYLFIGPDIDYSIVQSRLDEFVSYSMDYLKTSLEK